MDNQTKQKVKDLKATVDRFINLRESVAEARMHLDTIKKDGNEEFIKKAEKLYGLTLKQIEEMVVFKEKKLDDFLYEVIEKNEFFAIKEISCLTMARSILDQKILGTIAEKWGQKIKAA